MRKLICWLFGHKYVEDPGIERDPTMPFRPLYYKGWVPFCERCYKEVS